MWAFPTSRPTKIPRPELLIKEQGFETLPGAVPELFTAMALRG